MDKREIERALMMDGIACAGNYTISNSMQVSLSLHEFQVVNNTIGYHKDFDSLEEAYEDIYKTERERRSIRQK